MSYKIVVARYNENILWLKNELHNCIIYNKGEKLPIGNVDNEIILENVGRESETYLHYIITNYYDLPDVVVFTQGRIYDNKGIEEGTEELKYLINIKNEAFNNLKSLNYIEIYDETNNIHFNSKWNLTNGEYFLHDNYKNNERITFIDWFKKNININYPNPIYIYPNAIFAINKKNILKKSIEYYKKLILELKHNIDPAEGHFFERSWYYIFTCDE